MACPEKITRIVEICRNEFPCEMEIRFNESMAEHSTFRAGGTADCWLKPQGENFPAFTAGLVKTADAEGVPVFILGGGANILAADAGILGIVLDPGGGAGADQPQERTLRFRAGTNLDEAAEIAARAGLSGLEFLAGMPGSIGGAVWMNARCYGREIADVLVETEVISCKGGSAQLLRLPAQKEEFGYKRSPFQNSRMVIVSASFRLNLGKTDEIVAEMEIKRRDRENKGHYRYPSAGSVFKNNPEFGKPTGQIIDELGLRGMRIGGAQVSPWHGNMIINKGEASAADIRNLVTEVAARVIAATGCKLEPEILFVGDW
jgi:UDP-N-acetylmuramate dehydrogenase